MTSADVAEAARQVLRDLDGEVWPIVPLADMVACRFPHPHNLRAHQKAVDAVRDLTSRGHAGGVHTTWHGQLLLGYCVGHPRPVPGESIFCAEDDEHERSASSPHEAGQP